MGNKYLLPHKYRNLGIILMLFGIIASILYLYFDFRFKIPVFALVSSFLKTKYLTIFSTNFSDELAIVLLISGLSLIAFSKEKNEDLMDDATSKSLSVLRGNAMIKAVLLNTLVLFFSVLFFYGKVFIFVLIINMFSTLIMYIILYSIGFKKTGIFKKKTD
jgi:hypothetical protein